MKVGSVLSASDSPKCFTLGLGRLPKFSHGGMSKLLILYLKPRTSPERPYKIFGHPSWPKEASRRANAYCLRPQAEFTRASKRGLSRVKYFIKATKGMCKKEKDRKHPGMSLFLLSILIISGAFTPAFFHLFLGTQER